MATAGALATPHAAAAASDEVIVAFERGAPAKAGAELLSEAGLGTDAGAVRGLHARVLRVPGAPARAARALETMPGVAYAEPNGVARIAAVAPARPGDPLLGEQYALENAGQTGGRRDADIDATKGWALAGLGGFPAGGGPKIGVIDTGISQSHPDLSGKTVACAQSVPPELFEAERFQVGACPDENGHGTHVAGTLAAIANNGEGIAGVAFNARLVVCRALAGPDGAGSVADVANCIDWVRDRGARVISMSLEADASRTLERAVERAWRDGRRRGALMLAAAGNADGGGARFPAAYEDVVSVAATTSSDAHASFSNSNRDVELSAPGTDILSTVPGGYGHASGTSQAAPHAAGIAAILRDGHRRWSAEKARGRLLEAVDDLGRRGRDSRFGEGRVNLCLAAGGHCRYSG